MRLSAAEVAQRARPGSAQAPLGECTAGTLRCADARSYEVELRSCCRGHIRRIVAATVELLTAARIPYFADYGTLLGAVRNPLTTWADYPWLPQEGRQLDRLEPGIIPHDKDADFGVFWGDWTRIAAVGAALERQGYQVIGRPGMGSMKIRLSALNHTNLDLFFWRERANGVFYRTHYIGVDSYKGRDIPPGILLPLSTVPWEGLELSAPVNPEAFCAFRYGANWRRPLAANHDGVRR